MQRDVSQRLQWSNICLHLVKPGQKYFHIKGTYDARAYKIITMQIIKSLSHDESGSIMVIKMAFTYMASVLTRLNACLHRSFAK